MSQLDNIVNNKVTTISTHVHTKLQSFEPFILMKRSQSSTICQSSNFFKIRKCLLLEQTCRLEIKCCVSAMLHYSGVAGMRVSPSLLFPCTHIPRDVCFLALISLMHYDLQVIVKYVSPVFCFFCCADLAATLMASYKVMDACDQLAVGFMQ